MNKKNIYTILLLLLFDYGLLFSQKKMIINGIDCIIVKIDSIDNYYLINAKSNEKEYKIVSRKVEIDCSNFYIDIGRVYKFNLQASPQLSLNHRDYMHHLGGETFVKIDWGNNLFYADELCGLCYETDTLRQKRCKQIINQQEAFENSQ